MPLLETPPYIKISVPNTHLVFFYEIPDVIENISREVNHSEAVAGVRVWTVVPLGHDVVFIAPV